MALPGGLGGKRSGLSKNGMFLVDAMILASVLVCSHASRKKGGIQWEQNYAEEIKSLRNSIASEELGEDFARFLCYQSDNPVQPYNKTTIVQGASIIACPPPQQNESYAAILQALNMNVSILKELELSTTDTSQWQKDHFHNLDITTLRIYVLAQPNDHSLQRFDVNVLQLLKNLTELALTAAELTPLPPNQKLKILALKRGTSEGEFGDCESLEELQMTNWKVPEGDKGWLKHCNRLEKVMLTNMAEKATLRIITESPSLRVLKIEDSVLIKLDQDTLVNATKLEELYIRNSNLSDITQNVFLQQTLLRKIDLSYNALYDGSALINALTPLSSLKELSLSNNPDLENFCSPATANMMMLMGHASILPPVERLWLNSSRLKQLCFNFWNHIEYMDLSSNDITQLVFEELPIHKARTKSLEVDLRGNPVQELTFTKEDYKWLNRFEEGVSLTVHFDDPVKCECSHAWLAKAINESLVRSMPPCEDSKVNCQAIPCGSCKCQWYNDNRIEMLCPSGESLAKIPPLHGVTTVIASGNLIENLEVENLPESLIVLDVSDNLITHLNTTIASLLFSVATRQVSLAGNPITCECDTLTFIESLQNHQLQIKDAANMTCVDGSPVVMVVLHDLCAVNRRETLTRIFFIVAMVVSVAAFAAAVYICRSKRLIF